MTALAGSRQSAQAATFLPHRSERAAERPLSTVISTGHCNTLSAF